MPFYPFAFKLDYPQRRLISKRLDTLCDSRTFSIVRSQSTVYFEPVTGVAMLRPLPLTDTWQTSGAGNYARLRKTDYTLTTSSNWEEHTVLHSADYYLRSLGANEPVIMSSALAKNRGIWLSAFIHGTGTDSRVVLECGWSNTASTASGVALRFYINGEVDVLVDGVLVGRGSIAGEKSANSGSDNQKNMSQTRLAVCLIPYRKKELLIFSNQGNGFNHVFDGIAETETDPTITGAVKFWWNVPVGQADVQCAPLKYEAAGYVAAKATTFTLAPEPGAVFTSDSYYDSGYSTGTQTATATLREENAIGTLFTPDGVKRTCRIRIDLASSDNGYTPFVYGALASAEPVSGVMADESVDVTEFIEYAAFSVPDKGAASMTVRYFDPEGLAAIVPALETMENRPLVVDHQGVRVFELSGERPKLTSGIDSLSSTVEVEYIDPTKALEAYKFQSDIPLGLLNIGDAFKLVLKSAKFTDVDWDIPFIDFELPLVPNEDYSQWGPTIKAGDTAQKWIDELHETYIGNYFAAWVPTETGWQYKVRSPEDMETDPVAEIFGDNESAAAYIESYFGLSAEDARIDSPHQVYRSSDDEPVGPEANWVLVTGYDPRTKLPIQPAPAIDELSIDALLPVAARPANWTGEIWDYGLQDKDLTTVAAVEQARDTIYDRLTPQRMLCEWSSAMLFKGTGVVPVWKGDVVWLHGKGKYRVLSLGGTITKEPSVTDFSDTFFERLCKYVGERIEADE